MHVHEGLHLAADPDRERRRERQVRADRPGEGVRAGHLRHEGEEDADQDGRPRQVLRQQALDDRGHERRLRRRELRAADAVRFAHRVGPVEQEEGSSDDERRGQDADDESDLLAARRRADEVARLQVLRRRPRVGGRDADDRADAQRDGLVDVPRAAERHEDHARRHDRRDRHAGDRVRRGPDDPDDAGRHRDEEEPEHDHEEAHDERARERAVRETAAGP